MIILREKHYSETRSGYPIDTRTGMEFPRPRRSIPNPNPRNLPIEYKTQIWNGREWSNDLSGYSKVKDKKSKERVRSLVSRIESGNVYDNSPDDASEYTHYLPNIKYGNLLVYSKDINGFDRLTYGVNGSKEVEVDDSDNGEKKKVIRVKVYLSNCRGHKAFGKNF